ncbi:MAG: hypothetical protein APF84_00980 [Gracilibacter sp. BRH_c7a]|nr:MAG: hypothetical protein APF84_00980 [Gracilibacter sp. BRH_c7a]
MKRLMTIIILFISLLVVIGCSSLTAPQVKADNSSQTPSEQQNEASSVEQGGEGIVDTDQDESIEDGNKGGVSKPDVAQSHENNNGYSDFHVESGRYSGRADSNSIEIKISGVPEEMSYKVFMLSEELKDNFDGLNLQTNEVIKFKYTLNEHNQGVIFEISRI